MKSMILGLLLVIAVLLATVPGTFGRAQNDQKDEPQRQITPLQTFQSPDTRRKSDGDPNTKDIGNDEVNAPVRAQMHVITKRQSYGGGRHDGECVYDRDCGRFQYCDNSRRRGRWGSCRIKRH